MPIKHPISSVKRQKAIFKYRLSIKNDCFFSAVVVTYSYNPSKIFFEGSTIIMEVSNFVKNAKFSAIRKMFNESQKMTDVVSFSMGEPDFDTPAIVVEEACKQWRNHKTHYTPNRGILALRQAVARYHANDLKPDPEKNVCISNGGSDAIRIALCAILNPGDEVIVVTPCWSNYFSQVAMYGGKVVEVPAYEENEFRPTVKDVANAITDKTKCIIMNYPCNPTGAIMDAKTAEGLARLLDDKDIELLSDEVYSKFG